MSLDDYRTLGRSGLVISPLALGTMTFGTARWGSNEEVSRQVFNAYVDAGGILDVFGSDAFSFVTLTDSINKLPFVPGRLGSLGLFTEAPVPTTSIALEEQAGILTLVNPTPRGGPGETRPKPLRRARILKVPHYQLDDNVLAEEVQNVRELTSMSRSRPSGSKLLMS